MNSQGKTRTQLAKELGVSMYQVRKHLEWHLEKMPEMLTCIDEKNQLHSPLTYAIECSIKYGFNDLIEEFQVFGIDGTKTEASQDNDDTDPTQDTLDAMESREKPLNEDDNEHIEAAPKKPIKHRLASGHPKLWKQEPFIELESNGITVSNGQFVEFLPSNDNPLYEVMYELHKRTPKRNRYLLGFLYAKQCHPHFVIDVDFDLLKVLNKWTTTELTNTVRLFVHRCLNGGLYQLRKLIQDAKTHDDTACIVLDTLAAGYRCSMGRLADMREVPDNVQLRNIVTIQNDNLTALIESEQWDSLLHVGIAYIRVLFTDAIQTLVTVAQES